MPSLWQKKLFAKQVQSGGLVAYPTESVYGLGCDPENTQALLRLLALKNRDWRKGLILIGSSLKQFEPYLQPIPNTLLQKITSIDGDPTTWVLPARKYVSSLLTGKHHTLAVRLVKHELAKELCNLSRSALVSTSANKSGLAASKTAWQTRLEFANADVFTINGQVGNHSKPSRLIDPINNEQFR